MPSGASWRRRSCRRWCAARRRVGGRPPRSKPRGESRPRRAAPTQRKLRAARLWHLHEHPWLDVLILSQRLCRRLASDEQEACAAGNAVDASAAEALPRPIVAGPEIPDDLHARKHEARPRVWQLLRLAGVEHCRVHHQATTNRPVRDRCREDLVVRGLEGASGGLPPTGQRGCHRRARGARCCHGGLAWRRPTDCRCPGSPLATWRMRAMRAYRGFRTRRAAHAHCRI